MIYLNQQKMVEMFRAKRKKLNEEKAAAKEFRSSLLTRVYCDDISLEEIQKVLLDEWNRSLLTISYYDKNSKKMGMTYLKECKKKFDEPEHLKILNCLSEHLISKKNRYFDYSLYCKYMQCAILPSLVDSIQLKQGTVKEEEIAQPTAISTHPDINTSKVKKKECNMNPKPTYIERIGVRVTPRYENNIQSDSIKKASNYVPLIKDLFESEILEIGKYLYLEMEKKNRRVNAIAAWDRFETLIYQPSNNLEAVERMIKLLKRLEASDQVFIEVNEKKCQRILAKK